MEKTKICPICGATFIPDTPRRKYCSIACQKAGTATARAAWIQRAGHREKDRQRHREKRARARQARNEQTAKSAERRTLEAVERLKGAQAGFEERCTTGDPRALMIREKAAHGNVTRGYWELFATADIEEAETAGKTSRTTVNGFSVYADNFGADVAESIRETGHIIIRAQ